MCEMLKEGSGKKRKDGKGMKIERLVDRKMPWQRLGKMRAESFSAALSGPRN